MKPIAFVLGLALSYFTCAAPSLSAATIQYVATNLTDVNLGEDLWRYDYLVSSETFSNSDFFEIYFDASLFGTLSAGPAPNADWDVLILQQPNPSNIAPFDIGIYNAFALQGNPGLSGLFSVTAVYLGPTAPGAQAFKIFNPDGSVRQESVTVPFGSGEIPEPSTFVLISFSVLTLAAIRRRKPTATETSHR